MIDLVHEVTSDCFSAIARMRKLKDGSIKQAESIHTHMKTLVENMKDHGRTLGIPERDMNDIAYAIVALVDEVAYNNSNELRNYWMDRSLQLHFFAENIAGEGFYTRLHSVQGDGRRIEVLRVYYLCLLFGFQGKYAVPGGDIEIMRIVDSIRNNLERVIEIPDTLSPSGEPPDEPLVYRANSRFLLWVSLGALALAFMVFIGLRVSFDRKVTDIVHRVEQLQP